MEGRVPTGKSRKNPAAAFYVGLSPTATKGRHSVAFTVGVVGGGQLARMMVPAAIAMGIEIRVLAEAENSSAHQAATAVGDYRDLDTVREFAREVDAITFDHEHVPQEVLRALVDEGVSVHPGPDALQFAQNKARMRERLAEIGLPMPAWAVERSVADVDAFLEANGGRAVAKTPTGGYDGKGVRVISRGEEITDWLESGEVLLEELVDFDTELAQLIARRPSGESRAWPVVETIQANGVCSEVIAPARVPPEIAAEALRIATAVADELGVTGVLAVEMFLAKDGRVLVNELAMRPHNSGHFSIEGSVTSQFAQHLRAVLDLPLGETGLREPVAVMANVLGGPAGEDMPERYAEAMAKHPEAAFHSYEKSSRPGRKVGHVTVCGSDAEKVLTAARDARSFFDS